MGNSNDTSTGTISLSNSDDSRYSGIMSNLRFQKYSGLEGKTEELYINKKGLAVLITFPQNLEVRFGYTLKEGHRLNDVEEPMAQLHDMAKKIMLEYIDKENRHTTGFAYDARYSTMAFAYSKPIEMLSEEKLKEEKEKANRLITKIGTFIDNYLKQRIHNKPSKIVPAKYSSDLIEREQSNRMRKFIKRNNSG